MENVNVIDSVATVAAEVKPVGLKVVVNPDHVAHMLRMRNQAVAPVVRRLRHATGISQWLTPRKLNVLPTTVAFG